MTAQLETAEVTSVTVVDASGSSAGTIDLPAEIFGVQVNVPLIHQVVVAQLAAARQGTHDTKSRGVGPWTTPPPVNCGARIEP